MDGEGYSQLPPRSSRATAPPTLLLLLPPPTRTQRRRARRKKFSSQRARAARASGGGRGRSARTAPLRGTVGRGRQAGSPERRVPSPNGARPIARSTPARRMAPESSQRRKAPRIVFQQPQMPEPWREDDRRLRRVLSSSDCSLLSPPPILEVCGSSWGEAPSTLHMLQRRCCPVA